MAEQLRTKKTGWPWCAKGLAVLFVCFVALVAVVAGILGEPDCYDKDMQRQSEITAGANAGNAVDQNMLGEMYVFDPYLSTDYEKAVSWFLKAAEQGHAEAQFNLGVMYFKGKGVLDRDYFEAERWFQKAANQGHAEAKKMVLCTQWELGMAPKQEFSLENLCHENNRKGLFKWLRD
ncbi:MAG: tetratricopeptide repeat protein [Desulfobulbia bacterium]